MEFKKVPSEPLGGKLGHWRAQFRGAMIDLHDSTASGGFHFIVSRDEDALHYNSLWRTIPTSCPLPRIGDSFDGSRAQAIRFIDEWLTEHLPALSSP